MPNLDPLYNPVMAPAPLGEAATQQQPFNQQNQAMGAGLTGSDPTAVVPTLPVGSGNTMYEGPMFNQADISNVGGVTAKGQTRSTEIFIPEAATGLQKQSSEFIDAYKEGYSVKEGTEWLGMDAHQVGNKGAAGTKKAANLARREDRYQDKQKRQEDEKKYYEELRAGGMSKGKARRQARQALREQRRGQRSERKAAWDAYQTERDIMREQAADT